MENNRKEYQELRQRYYEKTKCYAINDLELYCDWLEDQTVNKNDLSRNWSLLERSKKIELLEEYSMWLTKKGYMDTDWKDEEPFAIDTFLSRKK